LGENQIDHLTSGWGKRTKVIQFIPPLALLLIHLAASQVQLFEVVLEKHDLPCGSEDIGRCND